MLSVTINAEYLQFSTSEIIDRFQQREEKAMQEVYELFYGRICYFAEKLVNNRQVAEEIAVDAFVKTFQSRVVFNTIEHLGSYLFTVVKNRCINYLKKEKRSKKHFEQYSTIAHYNNPDFENEILETTILELILNAAETLPPECKRIFDMLYKEHMSYQEIAEQLKLKVQTIRNQNVRALAHLRKKLQNAF